MLRQRTLKTKISTTGVGLHTGHKVDMTLRPAAPDTGIVFHRTDLPGAADLPALAHGVTDTRLATCLGEGENKVWTIEHLMSALAGLGIDNLHVDLSGPELPIMDGSAGPFVFLVQSAGIEEQPVAKRFVRVLKPVELVQGDKVARLDPFEGFRITLSIDFRHPVFERSGNKATIDFAEQSYLREVSRARTFGFMQDVEAMRAQGLALGGTLDNAVVKALADARAAGEREAVVLFSPACASFDQFKDFEARGDAFKAIVAQLCGGPSFDAERAIA